MVYTSLSCGFPFIDFYKVPFPISLWKSQNLSHRTCGWQRKINLRSFCKAPAFNLWQLTSWCWHKLPDGDKVRNLNVCGVLRTNSTGIDCVSVICKDNSNHPKRSIMLLEKWLSKSTCCGWGLDRNLGSIPSTQDQQLKTPATPHQGNLTPSSGIHGHCILHAHTPTERW